MPNCNPKLPKGIGEELYGIKGIKVDPDCFAERVREERKRRRYSQKELAEKAQRSADGSALVENWYPEKISRIESGKVKSYNDCITLAQVLDCSADYLAGVTDCKDTFPIYVNNTWVRGRKAIDYGENLDLEIKKMSEDIYIYLKDSQSVRIKNIRCAFYTIVNLNDKERKNFTRAWNAYGTLKSREIQCQASFKFKYTGLEPGYIFWDLGIKDKTTLAVLHQAIKDEEKFVQVMINNCSWKPEDF